MRLLFHRYRNTIHTHNTYTRNGLFRRMRPLHPFSQSHGSCARQRPQQNAPRGRTGGNTRTGPARDALRTRVPSRSGDGETPPALEPSRLQHFSPVACAHAVAKAMLTLARQALGLPCSFHATTFNHLLADILHDYTALRLTCQTYSPDVSDGISARRSVSQQRYQVGRMIRREMSWGMLRQQTLPRGTCRTANPVL